MGWVSRCVRVLCVCALRGGCVGDVACMRFARASGCGRQFVADAHFAAHRHCVVLARAAQHSASLPRNRMPSRCSYMKYWAPSARFIRARQAAFASTLKVPAAEMTSAALSVKGARGSLPRSATKPGETGARRHTRI